MKKQLIKEAFRLQQLAGIAPINEILPSSNTPRRKGLQKEQNGATKTYYTVNRYGVTEIVPYKSLGFDGSEQWEELSGFDSNIIKKYYTDNDGTGKVVVNANTSEDEMLADLERIDDDMWMESAKPGMQKEQMGQAKTTLFSPKEIKSVSFPNGTSFTVGDVDMEGGIVISIEQTATGFEVSGYGDGEGYTYYYDQQGNEMEMESAKPGMQKKGTMGMQKEYIISADESITEAFQKAGIDLRQPVICITDYGSHSIGDAEDILGEELLQNLEAERAMYSEEDPDFDQTGGIQFEYGPEAGDGLLGDDEDAVQGLDCKLIVAFSDSHLYEIWQ